jgi:hypothetical protein
MKTTIDIPDALLDEARRVAEEKGLTSRSVAEQGLRHMLDQHRSPRQPFRLRKHTFNGQGLLPEVADADWSEIRRRAHEDRGG